MAKRKKGDHAKLALRRLAEDEEVQTQLRTAAVKLREAWGRAAAKRPRSKAVEDKKLYTKLREGVTSLTKAVRTLGREPEPPKRRGRKLALVAVGVGGTAYALNARRSSGSGAESQDEPTTAAAVG